METNNVTQDDIARPNITTSSTSSNGLQNGLSNITVQIQYSNVSPGAIPAGVTVDFNNPRVENQPTNNSATSNGNNDVSTVLSMPSTSSNTTSIMPSYITQEGDIYCYCNKRVILRITDKEGPTNGLEYYKCYACNFFLWILRNEETELECRCNPPVFVEVKTTKTDKNGNKGKLFFTCHKGRKGCNFFQWVDWGETEHLNNQRPRRNIQNRKTPYTNRRN